MKFTRLTLRGWRQFADVDLEFHPRMTIIAGANGAGKSTLLRILAKHFGFNYELVATPTLSKTGVWRYLSGLFGIGRSEQTSKEKVGTIAYSNGTTSALEIPSSGGATYNVDISAMPAVHGLFIGSHRPVNNYQKVVNIPTNALGAEQAYQAYNQAVMNHYTGGHNPYSPTYRIKEAIVSMATFGPGNRNMPPNPDLDRTYEEFKTMLAKVLPTSIGFETISIRNADVVLVTRSGEFTLDAASGGLTALIDLAYQVFLYSRGKSEFAVVIDEPENHLHPSMQRVLLGNMLAAFPAAQFVIATHSPFIVSSVRESNVYVLGYIDGSSGEGPERTVRSERLETVNKAGTASDILRNVLGVPVTLPLWAEDQIEAVAADFDLASLDRDGIAALRRRLEEMGLGDYYADALGRMAKRL